MVTLEVPPLDSNFDKLYILIETGSLPNQLELNQLFDDEYKKYMLRETLIDIGDKISYDLKGHDIHHKRFDRLIILSLVLSSKEKFELLVKQHTHIESGHWVIERSAGRSRESLCEVSDKQSRRFINKSISAVLNGIIGTEALQEKLETYISNNNQ